MLTTKHSATTKHNFKAVVFFCLIGQPLILMLYLYFTGGRTGKHRENEGKAIKSGNGISSKRDNKPSWTTAANSQIEGRTAFAKMSKM